MKRILCIWLPEWNRDGKSAEPDRLEALAQWCLRFSPTVGVEEGPAPQCVFLDLTGLEHLGGGHRGVTETIAAALARRGHAARLAVADTPGAAWAVAHFHEHSPVFVPPGETLAALRPLPLEALRLPPRVLELLHALGLHRIGHLEPLPRSHWTARFGPELLRRWNQALGLLAEPIPGYQPPPQFVARQSWEHPIAAREAIEQVVEQLVAQVAEMLRAVGHGALRLACRLECSPPVDVSVGLFEATVSPAHLFQLLRLQLEGARLPGPVQGAAVIAEWTVPTERRQGDLFDAAEPPRRRLLAALIDRLSSRLGSDAVLRPQLVPDAQPEAAWQYQPLVKPCGRRSSVGQAFQPDRSARQAGKPDLRPEQSSRQAGKPDLRPRPLRLTQPVPVSPVAVLPEGPPVRFQFEGREHRVAKAWGPERIETGWWRGPRVGRDYFQVETDSGHRYWLFRRRDDGRWFVHGSFE